MINDEIMDALEVLFENSFENNTGEDFSKGVQAAMNMLGDLDTWAWEDMTDDEKDAFIRKYI